MAIIFFPKETAPKERRVAATPDTVKRLTKDGHVVLIEAGAGSGAYYQDADYLAAGAEIVSEAAKEWAHADIVCQLNVPTVRQVGLMKEGASLISFLWVLEHMDLVALAVKKKLNLFAMDAMPRTSRAQKNDALTSQASLAGYKAVLLAASHLPKIFCMQMTAAGTLRPSKVLVIGAGVAGLQAIATAKRLGAIVEVSDVRPEVKEQVQSLGAVYIEIPTEASASAVGGYAKEQTEEGKRKQQELLRAHIIAADVIITTALIPYKPAPKIITDEMVELMRPGSVIVDLAAERGGNCTLTKAGKTITAHGVTIVGELNLAATLPTHASDQYAMNVRNVLADATKNGQFSWDLNDDIVGGGRDDKGRTYPGALIVHEGVVLHPQVKEAAENVESHEPIRKLQVVL